MPSLFFPVSEIASNILDPLIQQIGETVIRQLGLRAYFETGIYYNTVRSTSSLSDDGNGNINLSRNRCDITVEEILNPAGAIWDTATTGNQTAYGTSLLYNKLYQNIFNDPVAKVSILERTMPAALNFTFMMKFLSYDAAQIAFSAILGLHHGTVVNTVHDVVYSYPIDLRMLTALSAVHQCRTSFTGDFNTYLSTYATALWQRNVRKLDLGQTPVEFQLVVQKQQLRCQAILEFTQNEPDVVRVDKLAQSYTVEFTYKVQFGRPNMLQLVLPVSVENTALPDVLFNKQAFNAVDFIQNKLSTMSFGKFMDRCVNFRPPPLLVRLPVYDDFIPNHKGMLSTAKYHSFVSAALTLDLPGVTVINFSQLGDYVLHPTVVEIIGLHSATDLLGPQGLFNLAVYADDYPLDSSLLTVDTQAMTVSIAATITTKIYRLLISEATDLKWVDPKWYPTLLQYRFFFPAMIERNLNVLLSSTGVQITADPNLVGLISHLMNNRLLDGIIQGWMNTGAANYHIYSYTQTAQQFGDYIALTQTSYTPEEKYVQIAVSVTQPEPGPVIAVADTSQLILGMKLQQVDFVADTTIIALTPTTITLSAATTESLPAGSVIVFTIPPQTLYDLFITACLAAQYITSDNIPGRSLRTPVPYPYGPNQGGFYAFNLPLRIFNVGVHVAGPH